MAPVVETGWEAVLQEAQEAGIPVILSDRQMDVDESLYECWVGGNFIKEGETAGNWLADYLKAQEETARTSTSLLFREPSGHPLRLAVQKVLETS